MSKQGRRRGGKRPRDDKLVQDLEGEDSAFNDHRPRITSPVGLGFSRIFPEDTKAPDAGVQRSSEAEQVGEVLRHKVAIPTLRATGTLEPLRPFKKCRTPHACDRCRKAKSGCSGEQPCSRCRAAQIACIYGDGKRDKERKRLSKLSKDALVLNQHNADIYDALRHIRLDMTMSQEELRLAIDQVLAMKPPDLLGDASKEPWVKSQQISPKPDEFSTDGDSDTNIVSPDSQVPVDMDTIKDVGRMADRGETSFSMIWTNKMTGNSADKNYEGLAVPDDDDKILVSNPYHTEDSDLEFYDPSNVQTYEWPAPNIADKLVQLYFEHVQPVVPLLNEPSFMERYHKFPRGSNNLSQDDLIWLSTVNTVFAISSVFSNMSKSGIEVHCQDHLQYLTRARSLYLDQRILYLDTRVSTTRALGLLSLYFISTCNLNRAWTFCALAIRHALRLDLHQRDESDSSQEYHKEHYVRLWWSLYSLECSVNELTGRPSCISDRDISTKLPSNIATGRTPPGQASYDKMGGAETFGYSNRRKPRSSRGRAVTSFHRSTTDVPSASVTSSTYLIYRIQLCIISHEITTRLYCAATIKAKWTDVQDTIRRIDQRLVNWRRTLPHELNIDFDTWAEPNWNDKNVLAGMGLAMQFCNSRIILFRPYLCRFEGRIKNITERTQDFDQDGVDICLKSAKEMITLLSAPARSVQTLYAIPPWWSTLHYLCEAMSVLLLEMAFQSQHAPDQVAYTLEDAKKGVRWLSMMSEHSVSARKAWEIFDRLVRHVAPMVSWSMFDLPSTAPLPPGYQANSMGQQQDVGLEASKTYVPESTPWNHELRQQFAFDTNYENTFRTAHETIVLVPNPLDYVTALQKFSAIVRLHGQYDDSWQHLFQFFRDQPTHEPNQPLSQGMGETSASQSTLQGRFDPDFEQYDTMAGMSEDFP